MDTITNLALNKPTTSSSHVKPYDASKAVNGTLEPVSRWLCNTVPGWMRVDLGVSYWINRWVVKHMGCAGWKAPDYNLCDFRLQGSLDDINWYDMDSVQGNTASITERNISPMEARYVRVYVTKGIQCNSKLASIMEFEVYPAPSSQYLSGLTLSSGTLEPPFQKMIFTYNANVGYNVSAITLTPTAEDSNAIITVNGVVVANKSASAPIRLKAGSNMIVVEVTASSGGMKQQYTVSVVK